ncbi:MAG: hypothetical protein ACRYG8_44145 [Janthinobacterium lividum]
MSEANTETASDVIVAPAEVVVPAVQPKRWTNHSITISNPERLRDAVVFARANNQFEQFATEFMNMLALIAGMTETADRREEDLHGHVGYDGSLHSFGWWAEGVGPIPPTPMRSRTTYMNGAVIYHGRHAGETFSMTLTSGEERPWQIHT